MKVMAIARKEFREMLRDRRSLASGLLYGIWGPLVMGIALAAMARQMGELGPFTLEGQGIAAAPALRAYLASREITVAARDTDPSAEVAARRTPVAIVVDAEFAERFSESRPARLVLLFDSSWPESSRQAARLRAVITDYARATGDTRLVLRGIAPSAVSPLNLVERDVATTADRAGRVLATLPIFVLLAGFIGGMGVAADVAAGERERGSLESLLLHPVARAAIVGGKWMTVSLAAMGTVTLAVGVSYAVLNHPRLERFDLPISMTAAEAVAVLLALAPLALAVAAVQLLIAFHARTYKEAQTKLSMLIFLPMIPGFLFAFGSLEREAWMAYVPMIGQHMLITDLVRGEAIALGGAAWLSALTFAVAGAAGWLAAGQLAREGVLQRTSA